MTQVAPIKRPFNCGGGYQDESFTAIIPLDFPGCATDEDNCVMQIYAHSVEPRTYAMAIFFRLEGEAVNNGTVPPFALSPSQLATNGTNATAIPDTGVWQNGELVCSNVRPNGTALPDTKDIPNTQFQIPLLYNDAFDTSHVDSQYSGYRGQQPCYVRANVWAAIRLQAHVGNGGLIPLGNLDKAKNEEMRNKIQEEIKKREAEAITANQAAQAALGPGECFEGALYGKVDSNDCTRIYTNTYVTNVDYVDILRMFTPQFVREGFNPCRPRGKSLCLQTPPDAYGAYPGPSLTLGGQAGVGLLAPPPEGECFPDPEIGDILPCDPLPALDGDINGIPEPAPERQEQEEEEANPVEINTVNLSTVTFASTTTGSPNATTTVDATTTGSPNATTTFDATTTGSPNATTTGSPNVTTTFDATTTGSPNATTTIIVEITTYTNTGTGSDTTTGIPTGTITETTTGGYDGDRTTVIITSTGRGYGNGYKATTTRGDDGSDSTTKEDNGSGITTKDDKADNREKTTTRGNDGGASGADDVTTRESGGNGAYAQPTDTAKSRSGPLTFGAQVRLQDTEPTDKRDDSPKETEKGAEKPKETEKVTDKSKETEEEAESKKTEKVTDKSKETVEREGESKEAEKKEEKPKETGTTKKD